MLINKEWTKSQLWQGCILTSIAHAIMMSKYPELSYEQSWNGHTYSVQDGLTIRGSITFRDDYCVGCFRNEQSNRMKDGNSLGFKRYLVNFPEYIVEVAVNETLQYVLEEIDGEVIPLITSSIWCDANGMYSNDNEHELLLNGFNILAFQLSEFEEAIEKLVENYEMNEKQVVLLRELFMQKIRCPQEKIIISKNQLDMIKFDDPQGKIECEVSFSELGFIFEI